MAGTPPKTGQTILFTVLANQVLGAAPFTVSAMTSSGLAASFASLTPSVCTVSGSTVTLAAAGTCTIEASQAGNATYSAATPVDQSFQVTQPVSQTIAFGALATKALGSAPFAVSASASSGLAVSFASLTNSVCTVLGSTVTLVSTGTCTIQATQPGNSSYAAAAPVNQGFQVTPAAQTITFGALSGQTLAAVPFNVSATASSGLPVSFTSLTTSVCTLAVSTVYLTTTTGTCTIQASQAGNASYAAATPVSQSFQVTKAPQTIAWVTIPSQSYPEGGIPISATASSGLPVSYSSLTPSVCTVYLASATMAGIGTCTLQASQAGNAIYAAATPVNQSFTVSPLPPLTITANDQTVTHGGAMPTLTYTVSPSIALDTPPTCQSSQNAGSAVGVYACAITCSGAVKAGYAIAYVAGTLTVIPLNAGANETVKVTDSVAVYVYSPISWLPMSVPDGVAGQPYPQTVFTASGGYGTVTFTESGTVPGIQFVASGSTLTMSGTPTSPGHYPFTVTATDSIGNTLVRTYSPLIAVPPAAVINDNEHITVSDSVAFPTTTAGQNVVVTYSASSQTVMLKATVTGAGVLSSGTVTFTLLGQTLTSAVVTGNSGAVAFTIPAATAAGTYPINATYSGAGTILSSSDNTHSLTINPGAPVVSVTSKSLAHDKAAIVVQLTIGNSGLGPAQSVQLTSVTINSTHTQTSPLPVLGTIMPGGSASTSVVFSDSVGSSGSVAILTISGSYTGGTFSLTSRVVLP